MDLVVEPARAHDTAQIIELQHLCYQTDAELYDEYAIPPLTQTLENLLGEYDTHQVLAAQLKDKVVGSVRGRLVEGTYHIGRLILHPRLQRRGLGTRLMRAIEEHFVTAKRYELFTDHLSEGNPRLYRGLGYTEFRKETVSPQLQLVYLEKFRINS